MENILISQCLLGINCKYNGGNNKKDFIYKLKESYNLIPFCSEVLGGLTTPRVPSERKGELVLSKEGVDVTDNFKRGAEETLKLAKFYDCKIAIVKSKSPSCGYGKIYDGNFSATLVNGNGYTVDVLIENGIKIFTEEDINNMKEIDLA